MAERDVAREVQGNVITSTLDLKQRCYNLFLCTFGLLHFKVTQTASYVQDQGGPALAPTTTTHSRTLFGLAQ